MTQTAMTKMRIALIQASSPDDEAIDARRRRIDQMVHGVRADLIVLPELWAVGYFGFDRYEAASESLNGPTVSLAARWAREADCYVQAGSIVEKDDDGRLYNTTVLIDPQGHVVHSYRKIFVFGYESREAQLLTPGIRTTVTQTRLGRISATTCYDLRFPELWRDLVDKGAEIVVTPAAWPASRLEHWRLFTSVRAVENQLWVLACNAVGTQNGIALGGHSRIVDPFGEVIAEAGDDEQVLVADIDLSAVAATRATFPALLDRRHWAGGSPERETPQQ